MGSLRGLTAPAVGYLERYTNHRSGRPGESVPWRSRNPLWKRKGRFSHDPMGSGNHISHPLGHSGFRCPAAGLLPGHGRPGSAETLPLFPVVSPPDAPVPPPAPSPGNTASRTSARGSPTVHGGSPAMVTQLKFLCKQFWPPLETFSFCWGNREFC